MDENLISWIQNTPKVELHCHLEGTVTPAILRQLVKSHEPENDLASSIEACEKLYSFNDFKGFLKSFSIMYQYIRTPADLELIVSNLDLSDHLYIELLYSPDPLITRGYSFPEILEVLKQKLIAKKQPKDVGIILDFVRNNGQDKILQLLEQLGDCLADYQPLVRGISIGGDEVRYPAKLFKKVFNKARDLGLHTSAHAGEAVGPESIWEAIFTLKTERIGHGLTAFKSPELIRHFRASQTHIEVSPMSNVCTGLIADIQSHPIGHYFTQGMNVSINTDDPGFFGTTLSEEYIVVSQAFNFTRHDIEQLLYNAAQASFQEYFDRLALSDRLRMYFESS